MNHHSEFTKDNSSSKERSLERRMRAAGIVGTAVLGTAGLMLGGGDKPVKSEPEQIVCVPSPNTKQVVVEPGDQALKLIAREYGVEGGSVYANRCLDEQEAAIEKAGGSLLQVGETLTIPDHFTPKE